ncbi:MAG: antibiotic ABC transporter permease [Thermodesulfatator sp.]|nr:MAG: antibiotic ABC transporter permease [Thermodesulfatator sp.]
MLRRIIALTIKEFITILKNKKSRMVLIIPPVAQIIVFGYAASFDLNNVQIGIYNEDPGMASRELIGRFQGSKTFKIVKYLSNDTEIPPLINLRKAIAILHFHRNFTRDMSKGKPGQLQVILDGRNSNNALITLNYIHTIVADFNRTWALEKQGRTAPARLVVRSWFNRMLDSHWFIIPGIVALLTIVVTLEVTALSVAKEREAGTFDQLLVTPMTPFEILVGKSLPGLIIGTLEGTFIILVTVFWFDIPLRGNILALYTGLFTFLLSAIGIGLMISSIAVTQQQGLMGAFMFLVPAVVLSGFATPISNMPHFVQQLTLLNPMRYFLVIVRSVFLQGASFDLLWMQYVPMAIIGILSLAIAGSLFRKRMY